MIRIKFELPPQVSKALKRGWIRPDSTAVAQIVETEVSDRNFRRVYKVGQGTWAPLTPEYLRRKVREGFSQDKFNRRGNTFKAMTTRVQLTEKGGSVKGKRIKLSGKRKGVITLFYKIMAPAATSRGRSSWFRWNNERRPWFVLQPQSEEKIKAAIDRHLERIMMRMGFTPRGRVGKR